MLDVEIDTDFTGAMANDNLNGTINYATVFGTIKREMAIPSKLLEHVAGRIAKAILAEHVAAQAVRIRLLKENPPMGADCEGAGVEVVVKK